jgi:hypothetical protein
LYSFCGCVTQDLMLSVLEKVFSDLPNTIRIHKLFGLVRSALSTSASITRNAKPFFEIHEEHAVWRQWRRLQRMRPVVVTKPFTELQADLSNPPRGKSGSAIDETKQPYILNVTVVDCFTNEVYIW